MKNYNPIIIVLMLTALGGALFIYNNRQNPALDSIEKQNEQQDQITSNSDKKLIIGSNEAKVTVVEYFDYKCPSCNNFHRGTGLDINKEYIDSDKANFEIRITPIIGPDSANAGRGAYCANEQDRFKDYHNSVLNYMYDNYYSSGNFSAEFENILTTDLLKEIAKEIEIDADKLGECIDSDKYNPNLDQNLLLAADDEIRGTPGFVIGEQSFVGGQPFSVFKTLINIELR
jgi:protein-disulfide isomerase